MSQDIFGGPLIVAANEFSAFLTRRRNKKERPWELVQDTLDMLQKVTVLHVKSFNTAVKPLIENGDIVETSSLLLDLVNNPQIPSTYSETQGLLGELYSHDSFKRPDVHERLKQVMLDLGTFQYTSKPSYAIADAIVAAKELWTTMSRPGIGEPLVIAEKADFIDRMIKSAVVGDMSPSESESELQFVNTEVAKGIHTHDDIIRISRHVCETWQRQVRHAHNQLSFAIGQLKGIRERAR